MTYREAYEKAERKLERGEITIGEFDELTKSLDEEIRPHGEWKADGTCSECGVYSSLNKNTVYFCPNCGADMRKEGESN